MGGVALLAIAAVVALPVALGVGGSRERPGPVALPAVALSLDDRPVEFVRDIRPILSGHCFACHGPDGAAREAGLDLSTFDAATTPLDDGARAVVPGDRAASELWRRINNPSDPMPPEEEHNALSPAQVELLGRWIDAGAPYAPHWAYVAPRRVEPPQVGDAGWPRSDADRFLLSRLDSEGLEPAPDADETTLIRRVTFDLTGLPPSAGEVDAFLADRSGDRFERVVDRLLASPHFGERMAMLWLDLVRYADTVGYHGDQEHRVWPYRDYVIDAFNANKPFDEFTIEQIAGDLLPDPSTEQLVATCYNRLLQTTHEGGLQLKEYRAIYQADRVRNVSEVWMGATMGCAQCHDHKYDPYTARDFYAMAAFFADIDDEEHLRDPYGGLNTSPTRRTPEMPVPSEDQLAELAAVEARLADVRERERAATAALAASTEAWGAALLARAQESEPVDHVWVDDALDTGGEVVGDWEFVRVEGVPPRSGERYVVQRSDGLRQHYTVNTTAKRIEVAPGDTFYAWVYTPESEPTEAVMLQFNVGGSWEHRAVWGGDQIPYGRRSPSWPGYRRAGPLPQPGAWTRLEIDAADVGIEPGMVVTGIAFTQHAGTVYWDRSGVLSSQVAPAAVLEALRVSPAERTNNQFEAVVAHQRSTSPEIAAIAAEAAALERQRDAIRSAAPRTLYTRALATPREVRLLPRGDWLDESGEVVEPGVPRFLGEVTADGRATRLDLARWLVSPEPEGVAGLTARVFVNRVWAMLFGAGLCPSLEDFGGQGEPPTHLELLDALALDFVESGWDVKALVRGMVLTRAYAMSSIPGPGVAEADPDNLLFARQARFRLPAEMVRDTALAVSGLLVPDIGGPSVKPPQPARYYHHLNFPEREYQPDTGPAQWRRGVYVHWQRQFLHPMLRAFDAPTREECTASRPVSNTPLAALTLLNDPVFVESARVFAGRLLASPAQTDTERLRLAMREATSRHATDREVEVLAQLLRESLAEFERSPERAAQLVAVGAAPPAPGADAVRLAAWTQVARAVLNLHETITRE